MRDMIILTIASAAIGALMRIIKTDGIGFPKKWIPLASLVVGTVGGFVAALQQHKTWQEALVIAFVGMNAGAGAVAGHEVVVEGMRDGREFFGPKKDDV